MQGAEVCFVPAIVVVIPRSRHLQVQFHTVLLFNGQKVCFVLAVEVLNICYF